ncbi:MAG: archaeosortase/exosortase family protein, partial [Pseudanabaena sp. ELA645]
ITNFFLWLTSPKHLLSLKRLIDYIPEIIIPLITGVSSTILVVFNLIPNKLNIISNFDAQFTAFMLHYIGFKVQRQGPIISLSNGSVEVFPPCSSIAPLATILPMLTIFLFIYHASRTKKIYVCISVILCTIFLNAIRISWLAIILNQGDTSGFEYWHGGEGVGIFSNLIVFFGAGLSYQILNYSPKIDRQD